VPLNTPPAREVANDPETASDECFGALIVPDGGAYLPWGPYLSPDDVRLMRGELAGMIEQLSTLEGWASERLADTIARAVRGPLSDLMPNLAHFNERLNVSRVEAAARAAMDDK
jgi:hypothetical protein